MSTAALSFGRLQAFGTTDRALLCTSIACSAIYFVTQPQQPFPAGIALKGACVALLAVLAVRHDHLPLGAALALSSLGDVLLELTPQRFVAGLAAFLGAHLVYIALFVKHRRRPLNLDFSRRAWCGGVLLYGVVLTLWLLPSLGELTGPVLLYICAITVMVEAALLADFAQPWVGLGAVLFLLSDSLIAVNKFKTPVPLCDYLVWATYYAGQYGIAVGFMWERSARKDEN